MKNRHSQPFAVQLFDLTLIQLANWRWSWRGMLITAVAAPLLTTLGLSAFVSRSETEALAYVLSGNLVMSLLFGTLNNVAGHFSYMRMVGRMDFFATLPIYRVTLIVATVIAFLVLALPSTLLTLLLGALILGLHLQISPLLLLVIPLIGLALSAVGVIIGLVMRTPEEVGAVSSLLTFLLVGFGPVLVPPDRLPGIIETLSLISPATYAASALRQTLLGLSDRIPLGIDLLVLTAVLIGSLWVAGMKMDWRRSA